MFTNKRVLAYAKENFNQVFHTTLNPGGSGVVRIHLVPPKVEDMKVTSSVAIINGQDIVHVNRSWSILLAEFMKEVNKYAGREMNDEEAEDIIISTCKRVKKVFPFVSNKVLREDIYTIMHTLYPYYVLLDGNRLQ